MAGRKLTETLAPSRLRLISVGVIMILIWIALGYRLVQVQVVKADQFAERGLSQRQENRTLTPNRGRIFDQQGAPLAMTVEAKSIYAVPDQVEDELMTVQQILLVTGGNVSRVLDRFDSGANFVYVSRQTELDRAQLVENMEFRGIYSHPDSKRVYPAGDAVSYVVGMANIDGEGIEGLEYQYEDILVGTPGQLIMEEDPSGRVIPLAPKEIVPAIPGQDVYTSIDLTLQYTAQSACANAVERTYANQCWAVVMETETGRILSLVGVPTYSPGQRDPGGTDTFSNFVIRGAFEPGSTQKMITVAAAIESGVVNSDTLIHNVADTYEITPGACEEDDDDLYGCYQDFSSHPTVDMTVRDIFTESSNVGIIKIGEYLGSGVLESYMKRFGMGQKTGVDFSGEASGSIRIDAGCSTCLASAAIGYSVAVTPLQLAAAYAAVGNDGVWTQPHLVTSYVDGDGTTTTPSVEQRQVLDSRTARTMRRLLSGVVGQGTGQAAEVPGYLAGGKTGTANKYGTDGYTEEIMASFVGIAPIDDPKLVVAVVVDGPRYPNDTGGRAAAPVFSEIMEAALHRQGVTPDGWVG